MSNDWSEARDDAMMQKGYDEAKDRATAPQKKVATEVRKLEGMRGDARLYRLDPPMIHEGYGGETRTFGLVVVSAAVVPFSGPETYIFPANEDGTVADLRELDGSFQGGLSHVEALRGAGYEVAP